MWKNNKILKSYRCLLISIIDAKHITCGVNCKVHRCIGTSKLTALCFNWAFWTDNLKSQSLITTQGGLTLFFGKLIVNGRHFPTMSFIAADEFSGSISPSRLIGLWHVSYCQGLCYHKTNLSDVWGIWQRGPGTEMGKEGTLRKSNGSSVIATPSDVFRFLVRMLLSDWSVFTKFLCVRCKCHG